MAEPGRVKALRAIFEKNATKPKNPVEFESTKASVARHNLKYAARRASRYSSRASTIGTIVEATPIHLPVPIAETQAEWMTFGDSDAFWLPELEEAIEREDNDGINRAVLKFFFEEHDPSRISEVDDLLKQNVGREEALFMELSSQYPEPSMEVAFELVEAEKKVEDATNWAKFDDDDAPIVSGIRRPTGVWAVNFNPWE